MAVSGNFILVGLGCVVCVVAVLVIAWALTTYNRLVRQRNQVEASWAQIDVQLKRRYDLIPNLVETVRGYAAHERGTLDAVVHARNSAVASAGAAPAERAGAETALTQTLGRLFAVAEAYPDLKANQNFLALQEELTATEGRVGYARQAYNDAVMSYNSKLQTFPTVIFAKALKFQEREYFETDEASRAVPKVQF